MNQYAGDRVYSVIVYQHDAYMIWEYNSEGANVFYWSADITPTSETILSFINSVHPSNSVFLNNNELEKSHVLFSW